MTSSKIRAITLSLVILISLPAMGFSWGGPVNVASAQQEEIYYEDFEDEEIVGWEPDDYFDLSGDGYYGDQSAHIQATDTDDPEAAIFEGGPTFHSHENFEMSGTYRMAGSQSVWFGIVDEGKDTPIVDQDATIIDSDPDADEIVLSQNDDSGEADRKTLYEGQVENTWFDFRLVFDGGQARAKVWEAGTSEPESWQGEVDVEPFESEFWVNVGQPANDREMWFDQLDFGGNSITGQVVDQNGDPVPNATVESVGTDFSRLEERAAELEDTTAEDLAEFELDNATDPIPDEWREQLDSIEDGTALLDSNDHFDSPTEVVAVHSREDWVESRYISFGSNVELGDDVDLSQPLLHAPTDERLVLSIWDPTDTCGVVRDRCGTVDSDLPGRTTTGNVVVEQISPTGEVVDSTTHSTEPIATVNPTFSYGVKEHEGVVLNPPEHHFYRVYPEGHEESAFLVAVGDPEEMAETILHNLEDEADQLTERAQNIRSNIDDGTFSRVTTTTDENGEFDLRMRGGIERAEVTAYRGDGESLQEITGPSLTDLHDIREAGYNGSVYWSGLERTDVPEDDVTLTGYHAEAPPWEDIDNYADFLDYMEDQYGEEFPELPPEWEAILEDEAPEDVEELQERLEEIVESNPEMRDWYEDRYGEIGDGEPVEDVVRMWEAIQEFGETGVEPGDPAFDDGLLNIPFPADGTIDEEASSVLLHWSDGSAPEPIPDEYVTVESGGVFGNDQLVVEDFPLEEHADDRALADVEPQIVTEDGSVERPGQVPVRNPAFDGSIPDIDAWDYSQFRPGSGDHVTVQLRSEDEAYGGLSDARVIDADGEELDASIGGEEVSFRTGDSGLHTIEITYEDSSGHSFTDAMRYRVKDDPEPETPTVRFRSGVGGDVAIVGDGLQSARLDRTDDDLSVDVVQEDADTAVAQLHLQASDLIRGDSEVDVSILHPDDRNVDSSVGLHVHTGIDEESIIWRNDRAVTHAGDTRFGEVDAVTADDREKRVIRTYSDERGQAEIRTVDDPGILERMSHAADYRWYLPSFGVSAPFLQGVGA